ILRYSPRVHWRHVTCWKICGTRLLGLPRHSLNSSCISPCSSLQEMLFAFTILFCCSSSSSS
ncbi:unnamed protein product, partial [Ectocarpus sp. 13 AM-2016]